MIDGVISGTGNSRTMKIPASAVTAYTTFSAFMAALAAGTFEIDLGYQTAGWTVEGTALNKANLLSDATAASLGLSSSATVDQAFSSIPINLVKISTATTTSNLTQIDISVGTITSYKKLVLIGRDIYTTSATDTVNVRLNNDTTSGHYLSADLGSSSVSNTVYLASLGSAYITADFTFDSSFELTLIMGSSVIGGYAFYHTASNQVAKRFVANGTYITKSNLSTINIYTSASTAIKAGASFELYGTK